MRKYFVQVTDDRVVLNPSYVWRSERNEDKAGQLKYARKIGAGFGRSDIKPLLAEGELNPQWTKSPKGAKHHLHVDLMNAIYDSEGKEYAILQITRVR